LPTFLKIKKRLENKKTLKNVKKREQNKKKRKKAFLHLWLEINCRVSQRNVVESRPADDEATYKQRQRQL